MLCKIGRDPNIDLLAEGVEGLRRLGGMADGLLTRQGGCTGCTVQGSCGTCMPLVQLYRKAKSPMERYCQHSNPQRERAVSADEPGPPFVRDSVNGRRVGH